MLTIDHLERHDIPDVLPLQITPKWQRFFFGLPLWRFRHHSENVWVYLTKAQYERIFVRKV